MDVSAHDYELVFGVDVQRGLTKSDRLIYGDSLMTHAMVRRHYIVFFVIV